MIRKNSSSLKTTFHYTPAQSKKKLTNSLIPIILDFVKNIGMQVSQSHKPFKKNKHTNRNFSKYYTLTQIKLGFTDHPAPKYREPKIYPGTDTRNDYDRGKWDVSHEIDRRDVRQNLLKTYKKLNKALFQHSKTQSSKKKCTLAITLILSPKRQPSSKHQNKK